MDDPSRVGELLRRVSAHEASGATLPMACHKAGVSIRKIRLWRMQQDGAGVSAPTLSEAPAPLGRPPAVVLGEDERKHLRGLYLRTNRGRGQGSMTLACRLAAMDANSPLTAETRAVILAERTSKHSLPRSLRDQIRLSSALVAHHRDPHELALSGLPHSVGYLRTNAMLPAEGGRELRRLLAGEQQSWDDATINFVVCVPWPQGGDACADKYGVRVGRFQLLAGTDCASDFCPGFSYVIRERESYRAADLIAAMMRVWRSDVLPDSVVLEGGAWQSRHALDALRTLGVGVMSAKGRPHMKLVENYWNRLWTVLSVLPGQVGRYRGEMERETDLMLRARKGAIDPRAHFPLLSRALDAITAGIAHLNREPVESRTYGRWIPAERYAADLATHGRRAVEASHAWLLAPVALTRSIVRGMVSCRVPTPVGPAAVYAFAHPAMADFEGAKVRVHFDPWDAPVCACVVLADAWHNWPRGHVVCRAAHCCSSIPVVTCSGVSFDMTGAGTAGVARKSVLSAVRREHRALGVDGKVTSAATEIRNADLSATVVVRDGSGAGGGRSGAEGRAACAGARATPPQAPAVSHPRLRSRMEMLGIDAEEAQPRERFALLKPEEVPQS